MLEGSAHRELDAKKTRVRAILAAGLCIYSLFNDAVSKWKCIASNGWFIVNNELERIWKELVMI
jgi:hypothetical protein